MLFGASGSLGRVSLHLYNSATRAVTEFRPRTPGQVGIYVCGATVQAAPHVGHLRPSIAFDVLRRWLERSGVSVTLIRNVTDIDDKILAKAAEAGVPWWAHAAHFEREFTAAYDSLGVIPPTYEPRATGHIPQMLDLIERLITRGHAYVTSPGNVWFSVPSFAGYGALTRQGQDEEVGDERSEEHVEKHSPRDFALWKAPKPGEPESAAWDSPWGRGRPGWHLECSAMVKAYLGEEFDIHGGGLDLRFPHHENEQAQSQAAGYGFARRWMHTAWITQSGEKMSKSLGNGLAAAEVLRQAHPAAVRLAIVSAHYRSMLEWTDETLNEATAVWDKFVNCVKRAAEHLATNAPEAVATELADVELPAEFTAAMNDDLNVPAALAVVHRWVHDSNTALASAHLDDPGSLPEHLAQLRAMLDVLGLDPLSEHWSGQGSGMTSSSAKDALDALVQAELDARAAAREAKDWAQADAIRDRLIAAGIEIQDGPTGVRWVLAAKTEENQN